MADTDNGNDQPHHEPRDGRQERQLVRRDMSAAIPATHLPDATIPASDESLCSTCSKAVDMMDNISAGVIQRSYMGPSLRCGSLRELASRPKCSLCRLILTGLLLTGPGPLMGDEGVTIDFSNRHKGIRGSFRATVPLAPESDPVKSCVIGSVGQAGSDLRGVGGREIDPSLIRRWVTLCEDRHAGCSLAELSKTRLANERPKPRLRAIDVEDSRVVELPAGARYITLSYVWGDVPCVRLTRANLDRLSGKGGIASVQAEIPQTIRDAMLLVAAVGERYLWVDALCLVSDDEADMTEGIASMDLVYERAWLNIIAASGFDASAGLPGVRFGSRRCFQARETIRPGLSMAARCDASTWLRTSRHATRGWTFQEERLARRSVVFVNQQVYWMCQTLEWSEDTTGDENPDFFWEPLAEDSPPPRSYESWDVDVTLYPWSTLHRDMMAYTSRRLTRESDVLNAFAGVLNRFSEVIGGSSVLHGLLESAFDISLLFVRLPLPSQSASATSSSVAPRRSGFPSYSWVGWRGTISTAFRILRRVQFYDSREDIIHDWLSHETWIQWYRIERDGTSSLIGPARDATSSDRRFRRFATAGTMARQPTDVETKARLVPEEYCLLDFWTLVLPLQLTRNGYVLDSKGRRVGWAALDCEENTGEGNATAREFLALSRVTQLVDYGVLPGIPEDAIDILRGHEDSYWIMAVSRPGPISERIGLGIVLKSALDSCCDPGVRWKEVLLG